MWDKLKEVEERFEEISRKLGVPEIVADRRELEKLSRAHKELSEIVATYRAYKKAKEELQGSEDLIEGGADRDLVALAQEEARMLRAELTGLEEKLRLLLLPKDPNDDKSVVLELRAGTGGDEAAIFVGDLFRMYTRYAEGRGWRVEVMSSHEAPSGGYKEIIANIIGPGAFSRLKYESGVHRVQRIPVTEAQGRIHTSTVTVAILPEAEEVELNISEKDLRIDVYRAGGPGGQCVNTTDSAVRITHLPTGVVVAMQDEKSQIKNREKAMKVLRARVLEKMQAEKDAERREERRGQIGGAERAEKIRTYNYPQSRISDHRIGLSIYSLDEVLEGDLDQLVEPLINHHQAEALKEAN